MKGFSKAVRDDIGSLLFDLQCGESIGLPESRPMRNIAQGAYELRIRDSDGIYRVFYYLKSEKGILVFHAFTKKTQKTPRSEIETGKRRLWEMLSQ